MANIEMNVLKVGDSEFEIADAQARQDCSDLKDDFHAYHSELGAGYADQLVSSIENTDSVPYNFRKVPYDATLEKVEGIVGVDVVLNQLVTFSAGSYTTHGITVTKGDDGSMTFDGTATGNIYADFYSNFQNVLTANHKYLFLFENPTGNETLVNSFGSPSITTKSGRIVPYTESQKVFLSVFIENGKTCDNEKVYPMVFDLTQTFGTQIADYAYSLEQSTAGSGVAWLKEHFSKIFDAGYVPYNAGTMVHVSGLSAKKTVGFNQWDQETVPGYYDASNGNFVPGSAIWTACKNYISCIPNTEYAFTTIDGSGSKGSICFYDGDKNFISSTSGGTGIGITVFTTPNNCRYMTIYFNPQFSANDICINLSDPTKNGTYEPYEAHEYPLDSSIDLHGILKLDANNQLYADGDVYLSDGTVNRRYILVNLGTQNWGSGTVGNVSFFTTDLGILKHVEYGQYANAICSKYVTSKTESGGITAETFADKSFIVWTNGAIYVKDSAYSDVASFKAGLSGVYLVAELATPTTETAEPYTANQICDPNGTEEYISETVAPVGHTTKYLENLRKKIEGLPWNFATLIAPTEATFKATRNYTTGSLFIVNNVLYKATANIANGATITPNSNCTSTTLAEIISALS